MRGVDPPSRDIEHGNPWIECHVCKMKSYHPKDVLYGYCGNCHASTSTVHMEHDLSCTAEVKAAVYDYLKRTGEANLCPPC